MKTIPLTRGRTTIVDDADYKWLSKFKWHYDGAYAARGVSKKQGKKLRMHCALLPPIKGKLTDHINRDKLDNRRANLRYVNAMESTLNQRRADNKSGFRGVQIRSKEGELMWAASTNLRGKRRHIGCFATAEEAARAYDEYIARAVQGDLVRKLMGKPNSNNTSGARNVYLMRNGRWQATVRRNYHTHYLGCFLTREAAVAALRPFHEEVR